MLSIEQSPLLKQEMHKLFRFLYLNFYAFLLLLCGITVAVLPCYRISKLLVIPQVAVIWLCLKYSFHLFATWKDKKVKYEILLKKNKNEFRPDTFKVFMQAPCGRLLTKAVLKDMGIKEKYKELLSYKEPFLLSIKNGCIKQETKIYINEDFK